MIVLLVPEELSRLKFHLWWLGGALCVAVGALFAGRPTLPSTLGREKATNPFLRCLEPPVIESANKYLGARLAGQLRHMPVVRHDLLQMPHPLRCCRADHGLAVQVVRPEPGVVAAVVAQLLQPVAAAVPGSLPPGAWELE